MGRPVLLILLLGVAVAAPAQTLPDVVAKLPQVIPPPDGPRIVRTLAMGFGTGQYQNDTLPNNGQFVRFTQDHEGHHSWMVDVGRTERFDIQGWGVGGSYTRVLNPLTSVTLGANTGTSDLFPDYRLGATVHRSILGNVVSGGLSYERAKSGFKSSGVHAGIVRWFPSWIVSLNGSLYRGSPGDTSSPSMHLGLTWYRWRRLYLGMGFGYGQVSYAVLGAQTTVIDYDSSSFDVGASWWIDDGSGINLSADYGDTDFYWVRGVNLSYFRQF